MKRAIFWAAILMTITAHGQSNTDSLLKELTSVLDKAQTYDVEKTKKIAQLQSRLGSVPPGDTHTLFSLYKDIYNEYRIFHYDSAYRYAGRMQDLAYQSGDKQLITEARLNLCFILLSSGLFRETYDSLRITVIAQAPDSLRAIYYTLMGRYYYDLANYDYDGGYHSKQYDDQGNLYMDSALAYYPASSFEYIYYSGLRDFKSNRTGQAADYFQKLLDSHRLTDHQLALTASTLSGIYQQKGQSDRAIGLMIQAAIADIRSSTKETFAIFTLADMFYKAGDVKRASLFIETAIANAEYYGARLRKVQVSSIVSLIESEKINAVESERKLLIRYSVVVTLLVVALVFLIVVIRNQIKKLKKAQEMITEAHKVQQQINEKLEEANKIKEEYIGYFFSLDSEFFVKLERLKKTLDQKIAERKLEDIRWIVNNIQPKKEKEDLLKSFDTVFLKIFPHFVDKFNTLFKEEDQIHLKDELLNIDLRIFALIRMGISDNEKIAQILGYSVNTIYAYKTRIKNRSVIPNDEFEARIMDIKSI